MVKNLPASAADVRDEILHPGVEDALEQEIANLPSIRLENCMDRGFWDQSMGHEELTQLSTHSRLVRPFQERLQPSSASHPLFKKWLILSPKVRTFYRSESVF